MRLIDADALKEMMYNEAARKANVDAVFSPYQVEFEYFDIEEYIDNAPTIEPNKLDLDIDYSIEYDKRPDGISNAKVTITRIKPTDNEINEAYFQGYKKGKSDERQFAERHTKAEPSGDLISRADVINIIRKASAEKKNNYHGFTEKGLIEYINALPSAEQGAGRYENAMQKLREMPKYLNGIKAKQIKKISAEPSGDVNAVEIYEQAERELERGQITLGEFEERIKPLKHLNYSAVRPQGESETEPAPVVAYICDRRRCAICNAHDGTCNHTTDIKHAAHFKNVAGQYFERPYMEEEEDGDL